MKGMTPVGVCPPSIIIIYKHEKNIQGIKGSLIRRISKPFILLVVKFTVCFVFFKLELAYFFVMSMIAKTIFSTNTASVIKELVTKAL